MICPCENSAYLTIMIFAVSDFGRELKDARKNFIRAQTARQINHPYYNFNAIAIRGN